MLPVNIEFDAQILYLCRCCSLLQIDKNGDGYIDLSELKEALDVCGFKLPGWKVRQMIEEYDDKRKIEHRGRLSFDEFEKVPKFLLCKFYFILFFIFLKNLI